MKFPQAIAAQLAGVQVRADLLVKFEFLSATRRVWNGHGDLAAGGEVWSGLGELCSIEGLGQATGISAPEVTFVLSGTEQDGVTGNFLKLAAGKPEEFYQRPVTVYLQFFNEIWQPLDNPWAMQKLLMTTLQLERDAGQDGAPVRGVRLSAETIFYRRSKPSYAYWSDRDQQLLYPGDRALERMALLIHHTVKWPDF